MAHALGRADLDAAKSALTACGGMSPPHALQAAL
jgi:hypothetical protein